MYNIITKIISNWINLFLAKVMSKEEFDFLFNRKIQRMIGFAQDGLHSIKIKNIQDLILKKDFSKSWDKVDCVYLKFK